MGLMTPVLVGAAASGALLVGAVVGAYWRPPRRVTAAILAFASGALITALAYDLFEQAFRIGGIWVAGGGLLVGATVFVAVDDVLEARGEEPGYALAASAILDGIPENVALGVALIGTSVGHVLALLAAIAANNVPEALGSARSLREEGKSKRFVIGFWAIIAVALTAAVVVGNAVFAHLGETYLAAVRAFAGGAVLASVAVEVMPDAYEGGGPTVGLATVLGFLLTFTLT